MKDFLMRLGILGELLGYLWKARMYWMIPMVVVLIFFAILIFIGSSGSAGSVVYSIF